MAEQSRTARLAERLYPVVLDALVEGMRVHRRYSKTALDIVYAVIAELALAEGEADGSDG